MEYGRLRERAITIEGIRFGTGRFLRTLLLGVVEIIALSALSLYSNLRYGRYITAASLPNGALFCFVVTLIVNALWRRFVHARSALALPELALLFSMLFLSAALPQASVAETLVTLAVAPQYLPRSAPYVGLFAGAPPRWLLVQNPVAIRRFYEGYGPAGGPVPWKDWLPPLLGWSVFVALLLLALHCLSRAFMQRWVREERVSFPLMDLPLELLGGPGSSVALGERPLWRQPLFFIGAALPAAMITVGQFHTWFPTIPAWEQILSFPVGKSFTTPPLSALSDFTISIWPLVIGIGYLLNSEVAVSIWTFHLLFWLQMYLWAALGYTPQSAETAGTGFNPLDWIHNNEFGGALALAGLLLGTVRKDIVRAARRLIGRQDTDPAALTIAPGTIALFLLANSGMLLWGWAAGASPLVVAAFLVFLYAIVIAMGRMVAAGGLYLVDNGYEPQALLYGLVGANQLSPGSHFLLTGQEALFGRADMSYFYFATNESKLAEETGWTARHGYGFATVIALATALVSAYVFILIWSYRFGAVSFHAWPLSWNVPQTFDKTAAFLTAPSRGPRSWTYGGILVGFLLALLLAYLNRTFLWWRLSPFGFVVASSWNISNQIWSSVFLGWLIAALVRRYGGLRVYRSLRPFFLGLIVGDAVTVCLMAIMETIAGVRT